MSTRLKSAFATAVISVLIIILMLLVSGYRYVPPIPPPPEEGVEVNVGDSDFGYGSSSKPASEATSYAPPAAQQQTVTQRTQPTVPIPSSRTPGTVTNPAAVQQPTAESKEPEINKSALYPGKRNQNSGGGSEGNTQGNGNQGTPDGSQNSNNYAGRGGSSGNYSLAGRTAVKLPEPTYRSNNQGTVVIRIWVDQQGRVTRAEYQPKGSNTQDGYLVGQAKAAALKAKFNASSTAPEEQMGTITYIFKI